MIVIYKNKTKLFCNIKKKHYFCTIIWNIMAFFGLFGKEKKETLDKGLEKSKESVLGKISRAIAGKSTVDEDVLDNLEEADRKSVV